MAAGKIRQGGVYIEIGADPKKFFAAMNRVNQRISRLGGSLKSFGASVSGAAAGMAVPMGLALRHFASFDDAIRSVQAVTGSFGKAGAAAFASLTQTARDLGSTTSFTATEVASLMTELGRAGFDPGQINAMTGAVLDLAKATGTEAALSAQIMANAIRQFSLGAGDAARVADVLTMTANSTNNTVEGLGEALKYAGVAASQAGLSIEETLAILGALGNVGINGSQAGTVLRRLVSLAAGEAKKLEGIFTGVKFLEDDGSARNIIDIFRDISAATANMPSGERIAKFNEAFGLLGLTGAQAIGGAVGDIDKLVEALANAGGTANKTATAMESGLGGALRKALSAMEGVVLSVGNALAPAFQKLVEAVTTIAGGINEFIQANSAMIAKVGMVTAAVLAGGVAFIGLGAALQAVAFAAGGFLSIIGGIGAILTTVVSVVGLATAGITTLFGALVAAGPVAGIAAIAAALMGVSVAADAVGNNLSSSFTGALESAQAVFADLYNLTSVTMQGIFDAVANGNLAAAADILWAGLYAGWLRGQAAIMNAVDPWIAFFQNTFDYLGVEIYASWASLWSALSQGANTMGAILAGIIDNVLNGIAASWDWIEGKIRRHWILITGLLQGGKDVSNELKALEDEMAGRAAARETSRPGIARRMKKAEAENAQKAAETQQSNDAARAGADQRAADRLQRNDDLRAERQAAIDQADSRVATLSGDQASLRKDRNLADTLIQQLSETDNIDEFNTIIAMIQQMIAEGKLTESQQARFDTAVNTGADNIARSQDEQDKEAASRDAKLKDGAAAATDGSTAGTFSSVGIGNILGSGSGSAAERTAKAAEATARHTQKIADNQAKVAE